MGHRPLVLVVDDEPSIAALIAEVLTEEGYAVATAGDGEEALRRVGERRPELVLLDLVMPRMDGRAFLAACRQRPDCADLAVVVLSAWPVASTFDWGAGRPAVRAAIEKPFHLDELLAVVGEATSALSNEQRGRAGFRVKHPRGNGMLQCRRSRAES